MTASLGSRAFILSCCMLSAFPLDARAQGGPNPRTALQAIYAQRDKVGDKNDAKAWLKWYQGNTTTDYTVKGKGEKAISREELLKKIEWAAKIPMKANSMVVTMKTAIATLQVNGGTALAEVTEKSSMASKVGKKSIIVTNERIRDTWSKTAGTWKLSKREVLDHKQAVIAAKPPAPKKPPAH